MLNFLEKLFSPMEPFTIFGWKGSAVLTVVLTGLSVVAFMWGAEQANNATHAAMLKGTMGSLLIRFIAPSFLIFIFACICLIQTIVIYEVETG